jgi:anti-sigma factor RsiW
MDMWTEKLSEYIDGELDATSVEQLEQHVRACADCRAIVADLRVIASQAASLQSTEPSHDLWSGIAAQIGAPAPGSSANDARAISLDAHRDAQRTRGARSITMSLPQLAAAAIILIVIGGTAVWKMQSPRPSNATADRVAQGGDAPVLTPGPVAPSNTTDVDSSAAVDGTPASAQTGKSTAPGAAASAPAFNTRGNTLRNVSTRKSEVSTLGYDAAIQQLQNAVDQTSGNLDPKTKAIIDQSMKTIDRAIADARAALAADPSNAYLHRHLDRTMKQKLELLRQAAKIDRGGA